MPWRSTMHRLTVHHPSYWASSSPGSSLTHRKGPGEEKGRIRGLDEQYGGRFWSAHGQDVRNPWKIPRRFMNEVARNGGIRPRPPSRNGRHETMKSSTSTKRPPPKERPQHARGAKGIRTPDPLHAMEMRYQLRHSPDTRPFGAYDRLQHLVWMNNPACRFGLDQPSSLLPPPILIRRLPAPHPTLIDGIRRPPSDDGRTTRVTDRRSRWWTEWCFRWWIPLVRRFPNSRWNPHRMIRTT